MKSLLSEIPEDAELIAEGINTRLRALSEFSDVDAGYRQAVDAMGQIATSYRTTTVKELFAETDEIDIGRLTIPELGWESERRVAVEIANARIAQADERLDAAIQIAQASLITRARPKIDPDDMALRDELRARFARVSPNSLESEAMQLAQSPRRDISALLLTQFGESFMLGQGMDPVDTAESTKRLSRVVALTAEQHGITDGERRAGAAFRTLEDHGPKIRASAVHYMKLGVDAASWSVDRERKARALYEGRQQARIAEARKGLLAKYDPPRVSVHGKRLD